MYENCPGDARTSPGLLAIVVRHPELTVSYCPSGGHVSVTSDSLIFSVQTVDDSSYSVTASRDLKI